MHRDDALRMLACPVWGLASWATREREREREPPLYGASADARVSSAGLGALIVFVLLLGVTFILFWLLPMIRAFSCGDQSTTLGASGLVWGLLILFIGPIAGFVFFVAGGRCKPALADYGVAPP